MSYLRVIPRDLFNEANLLKCYGQLYLALDSMNMADCLEDLTDTGGFDIYQNPADGSLTILNVTFTVRGKKISLMRPLNSRDSYPLYAEHGDIAIQVFDDFGNLTEEMYEFLAKEDCN